MKRTLRIYEGQHGEHVLDIKPDGTCWADGHDEYFPVSEPFEVEIVMLADEDVMESRISNLEHAKAEAHANWLTIAAVYDDKIAKLRALPHLPE